MLKSGYKQSNFSFILHLLSGGDVHIIIHVVSRNIFVCSNSRWQSGFTCQAAFILPQRSVEVITASSKQSRSPRACQLWWEVFLRISSICCKFTWNPWNLCMMWSHETYFEKKYFWGLMIKGHQFHKHLISICCVLS